jgi:hypothetical protein
MPTSRSSRFNTLRYRAWVVLAIRASCRRSATANSTPRSCSRVLPASLSRGSWAQGIHLDGVVWAALDLLTVRLAADELTQLYEPGHVLEVTWILSGDEDPDDL